MDEKQREKTKNAIKDWLIKLDNTENLPNDIVALNFGLYEPYGIELIGSKVYDPENDDWACEEDFEPAIRNCPNIEISENDDWETVLKNIIEILEELVSELSKIQILHVKHITTGFCDGDLVVIR